MEKDNFKIWYPSADLQEAESSGEPGFIAKIVTSALSNGPKLLDEMKDAISVGAIKDVLFASHTLKSTLGALELSESYRLCSKVEELTKLGDVDGVLTVMEELEKIFLQDQLALWTYLKRSDESEIW